MTGPANDAGLAPARRGLSRLSPQPAPTQASVEYEDVEVARGQAAAVLGALGRMQLRIDVLAREQSDLFAKVLSLLEEMNSKLDEFEEVPLTGEGPPDTMG